MSNFSHLLSKHGVLASFNIARKVKTNELNKMKSQLSTDEMNSGEFLKKLHTMITLHENQRSVDDIPGLIVNKNKSDMMVFFDNLPPNIKVAVTDMSNKFSVAAVSKKLDIPEILIAIQLIFNQLGISTDDLKQFNKKFKPPESDEEPDEEDDEDEDGEY